MAQNQKFFLGDDLNFVFVEETFKEDEKKDEREYKNRI